MKSLLLGIFAVAVLLFFMPLQAKAQQREIEERIEAKVVKVIENSEIIETDGHRHPYQKLELLGTSGSLKNKSIIVENGKLNQVGVVSYEAGDHIVVSATKGPNGENIFTIADYVRRGPLLLLAIIFIVLTILIGGKRGFNALLGMVITFVLLFLFVLPQILSGSNPVFITAVAAIVIVPVTFYLSHGFNKKTLCAIIGTFIALTIACIMAAIMIEQTHLTGFASEEAGFLDVIKGGTINIQGLLFAGIVIALLGILEDITVSQAAIVYQLKNANKKLHGFELFKRAMDIGRDHIASMANTLVLVYAGASLPLLLLFINNPLPFSSVINTEMIAEEIVRTLVASIGLILAVPITTAITSLFATSFENLNKDK